MALFSHAHNAKFCRCGSVGGWLATQFLNNLTPSPIPQNSCRGLAFRRKLPARYKTAKKNRDRWPRDDVYFYCDQAPPKHSLKDAVETLKAYDLFGDESIKLSLKVNMGDGKGKIGLLKGLMHLPRPVGEAQVVLVFAEGPAAEEARRAGAYIVGGLELIKQVEKEEVQFNHCLSTLEFLPKIKHLQRILKDKMPNTRRGTATDDLVSVLTTYKFGETYSADKDGNIDQVLGKSTFSNDELARNFAAILNAVDKHKTVPRAKFFQKASLEIGPGPKLELKIEDVLPIDDL